MKILAKLRELQSQKRKELKEIIATRKRCGRGESLNSLTDRDFTASSKQAHFPTAVASEMRPYRSASSRGYRAVV